jgi:hypothetical protein
MERRGYMGKSDAMDRLNGMANDREGEEVEENGGRREGFIDRTVSAPLACGPAFLKPGRFIPHTRAQSAPSFARFQ